jgi:hypothetical protein
LQQRNVQGELVKSLAIALCSVQGLKDVTALDFINPVGVYLYQQEARRICAPTTAKTLLRLVDEGKLPGWVASELDMKLLRAAA